MLATGRTVASAGDGFACRPMGAIAVRGREGPVEIFEVTGSALAEDREGADGGGAPISLP